MLNFKSIKFKNFLSFGHVETTIQLDTNKKTLIVGNSGSGKSSIIIESLTYALFGKAFRKVKKGELVNKVNNKECIVTLNLEVNNVPYVIIRGMKPDIFEIYQDGVFINQDPAVRDYQAYLETHILKINYKTFCQVCALGYANFTPFMQLSSGDRRAMVDEILGTQIFIKMFQKTRDKLSELKNEILLIDNNISNAKSNIELQKSNLSKLKEHEKEKESGLLKEIEEHNSIIEALQESILELQEEIGSLQLELVGFDKLKFREKEISKMITKFESTKTEREKVVTFFKNNDTCPTCQQDIKEEHKNPVLEKITADIDELVTNLNSIHRLQSDCVEKVSNLTKISNRINELEMQIFKKNSAVQSANKVISSKNKEISQLTTSDNSLNTEILNTISTLQESVTSLFDKKLEIQEQGKYLSVAQTLFKDDGIRAQIIKEYIPVLNELINQYLDTMNFPMRVELDEQFNERILSRFRDEMSYSMLSQGEQSRVSLAMTLAWRKLAELRNSVRINILLLDEILDATISAADLESIIGLLMEIAKDTSLFVISHKPQELVNYVDDTIVVEKQGNFSHISMGK
jgi:DNA repair exonuclease SbcCD ATPase subunit